MRQLCADIAGGINLSLLSTFLSSTTLAQARTALGVTEGSASQTAFAALTNAANKVPYMTGSDAWSTFDATSFFRSLGAAGDAATARTTLGAQATLTVTSNGNGTSISLPISGTTYKLQFGTVTVSGAGPAAITFPEAFSGTPTVVCSGGSTSSSSSANDRITARTSSGATITSDYGSSHTSNWVALGS